VKFKLDMTKEQRRAEDEELKNERPFWGCMGVPLRVGLS